jgi:manganese/zinc/iron transport system permease protein
MIGYNTLMVLLGSSLLGACAGLVGGFAVLRRRALTGDALAHAALPGLCLAFLLVGDRNLPSMLVGAFAVGLLGVSIIPALRRWTRIKEDAAIGIVLSVFFAFGLVLLRRTQEPDMGGHVGGLDSFLLGKTAGMVLDDVILIALGSLVCLAVVLLLYKEFKLITFDADFGRVQGWPALRLDLLLLALLAVTVAVGLPAVGVVMIAALLIIPAAAARFWTERLGVMLALAAGFGFVTGAVGTLLSAYQPFPAGPIIILVGATIFLASLLGAPRRGVVARWLAYRRFRRELEERNLLRHLFDLTEPELPRRPAVDVATLLERKSWSRARLDRVVADALADHYVERDGDGGVRLTERGVARSAEVARGHRLWELFLTEYADQATGVADLGRESLDGIVPPYLVAELRDKLERAGRMPRPAVREVTR